MLNMEYIMKYYQIIVNFRKSYRKLNYVEKKLTVGDLFRWVNEWCEENRIPENISGCFHDLALSYVDEELDTRSIYLWAKRKNKQS